VQRLTWTLVALGAIMTAAVLGPIVYIESGKLVPLDASYVWMMIVPALAAGAVLLYQLRRGIDRPSSIATILIGSVIATYPFWGPSLDESFRMPLDWVGTILGHYVAGALVVLAGALQLMRARAIPARTRRTAS
jgi:hypothetical protein